MGKFKILVFIFLFSFLIVESQEKSDDVFVETKITLQTKTGMLFGTLTTPRSNRKIPVALLIAGSGPTDRDGNNPFMKNDALKKLAFALAENQIASVRFDKRGIAESKAAGKNEADLRFEDYVMDAKQWIDVLKEDKRFSTLTVIGHSEGSLIGMIAAAKADKFVSIAGVGQSADHILKQQLSKQPKEVQEICFPIIDSLKNGKTVDTVNLMLYSLFRPSVQPYLISWFRYNPQKELQKLSIPLLILQGTNDIQVTKEEAFLLANSNTHSQLVFIENMNHIFRIVEGDRQTNLKTYTDATLPISTELTKQIIEFISIRN